MQLCLFMKRILFSILIIVIICALAAAYIVFAPATKFSNSSRYLYVRDTGSAQAQILHELDTGNIIRSTAVFNLLAKQTKAWQHITPGRFEIKKDESIFSLVRTLRNNHQ